MTVTGLATALVLTAKLPVEPEAHSGITEGDTLTLALEVETTAEVPATPAGADNVNDPVTEDPPTTDALDSTTVFNVPPAAGFKLSVARPATFGLATLVAVTVTVIFEGTSGGASLLIMGLPSASLASPSPFRTS